MAIVDRLFALVDQKYNEQKDFAAVIGVDPNLPSRWRNRKSQSYQKYLPQIADALGTSVQYLLTGEQTEPAPGDGDGLSEKDQRLLKWFRSLPPEKQRAILNLGDGPEDAAD